MAGQTYVTGQFDASGEAVPGHLPPGWTYGGAVPNVGNVAYDQDGLGHIIDGPYAGVDQNNQQVWNQLFPTQGQGGLLGTLKQAATSPLAAMALTPFVPGLDELFQGLGAAAPAGAGTSAGLAGSLASAGGAPEAISAFNAAGPGTWDAALGGSATGALPYELPGGLTGGVGTTGAGIGSGTLAITDPFAAGSGAIAELGGAAPAAAGVTGALGTAGNAASAGTALSRVMDGTATAADYASLAGTVGSTALGAFGANKQADALSGIADKQAALRQPFYDKALGYLSDPASFYSGEGAPAFDAVSRKFSVGGNPAGDPFKQAQIMGALQGNYQSTLGNLANLGLTGQSNIAQLQTNAAGADNSIYKIFGSGLGDLTNPQQTSSPQDALSKLLAQIKGTGSSQYSL